jgi:outer membrane murein-binding lipoprotein Lpp
VKRILFAVLVASTLGAAAPQGAVSVSQLVARVDSLAARVDSLEARRHGWRQYVRSDSTRARCHATTKAGHQCKRKAARSDSLCTQHRNMTKRAK